MCLFACLVVCVLLGLYSDACLGLLGLGFGFAACCVVDWFDFGCGVVVFIVFALCVGLWLGFVAACAVWVLVGSLLIVGMCLSVGLGLVCFVFVGLGGCDLVVMLFNVMI